MQHFYKKGQISLFALIGTGVTIALASISAFFVQNNRIGKVEGDVQTIREVADTQYENMNKRFDETRDLLKAIAGQKGITLASSSQRTNGHE